MAKTESTAVNELIGLVQGGGEPHAADPGADLFSAPKSTRVTPSRMTSPIPALRGAGEVEPLPRRRAPNATGQQGMSAAPPPIRMSTADASHGATIPPIRISTNVRATQSIPRLPQRQTPPPPQAPVAAPFDAAPFDAAPFDAAPFDAAIVPQQYPVVAQAPAIDSGAVPKPNWFEVSSGVGKVITSTHVVPRPLPDDTISLIKKLILPTILVGVLIGTFIALRSDGKKQAAAAREPVAEVGESTTVRMPVATPPAPSGESANAATASAGAAEPEPPTKAEEVAKQQAAAAAEASESMLPAATTAALTNESADKPDAPAPAAAHTEPASIREIQTARGVVKLVDVRIDSQPAGATVMLVDNGKSSFLGTTPLATSVDPSRKYDVIFTLAGRPTQMAPLDPQTTTRLDVTLGRDKSAHRAKKDKKPQASLGDSFIEEKQVAAEKKVVEKQAEPAGEGTLMVSTKPPCEILIDGKATGLTTPQRSIPLAAGAHKITFVNEAAGIKKTVSVTINADQPTKLIQNLMQ